MPLLKEINVKGVKHPIVTDDGYYQEMSVGGAEQLISNVTEQDQEPYNFRTAGGSLEIGDRLQEKLVGGTVAWNQLFYNGNFANGATDWARASQDATTISVNNNILTLSIAEGQTFSSFLYGLNKNGLINSRNWDHKFFFGLSAKPSVDTKFRVQICGGYGNFGPTGIKTTNVKSRIECVITSSQFFSNAFTVYPEVPNPSPAMTVEYSDFVCFDLTAMFGTTIADYVYSLETATAGAGVAWLKSYGFFTKPYYEYNVGSLQSVKTSKHVTVGFNPWDEEWEPGWYDRSTGEKVSSTGRIRNKNKIKIIPNSSYYFRKVAGVLAYLYFYDANEEFISYADPFATQGEGGTFTPPTNAYYMSFMVDTTTYNHDVCINLHHDGERDGEYEKHVEHVYPLPTGDLRGIFELDSNNKLRCDGDICYPEGKTNRRYGIVDLGTLNWTAQALSNNRTAFYTSYTSWSSGPKETAVSIIKAINPVLERQTYNYADSWGTNAFLFNSGEGVLPYKTFAMIFDTGTYSDATAFKSAMNGKELVYELATPTEEESTPFQSPQIVDDFGTEEYVDAAVEAETRDVAIPVGHDSGYQPNLRAKLEMAPDSPSTDGTYVVKRTNGQNSYVPLLIPQELPSVPTEDGSYVLKCTVSSGTATLSWESEE